MIQSHSLTLKVVASTVAGVALAAWWLSLGPRTPLDRASAAYDRGDYREARALAVEILKQSPDDPGASRVMARASARLGNDETAQTLYGRIGEKAMQAEDFFVLGSTLERRGEAGAAITVLERGRKVGPDHAETLHSLARLYAGQGRLPEAIDAAGRLAKCPGWEARGSLILGVLDVEDADPEGAASAVEAALRVDPNLAGGITSPVEARKLLAAALLRTSHADRALEALGPVLAQGGDPEASWLASRALLRREDIAGAKGALALAGDFGKDDPTRPEPAPYVGAGACAGCHPSIFQAQRGGRHARTFFGPDDLKAIPLPDHPIADKALPGASHSLRREGDAVRLTTRSGGKELSALVEFAVGSGDRGLTMVARDEEGLSRVCRVSSYLGGTLWDLTSHAADPQPDDPGGPLGRPMSRGAAEKCVACHVTSPRAARDRKAPEAADRGIGCERCHGPAGNHLVAMKLKFPEPAIARPSKASAAQINKLCGACHQVDDPSTTEADPRFVRFQATTLPLSRCYAEGQGRLSCVTCHDPHRDADTNPITYEARCLACHGTGKTEPPKADRAMRRTPCPVNPTSGCIACHMPKVEGAAPHASFTDHKIRVHKPAGGGE
jgi:tetratricopeptide (TPR) repeat protein